jgi:hypothetical protein
MDLGHSWFQKPVRQLLIDRHHLKLSARSSPDEIRASLRHLLDTADRLILIASRAAAKSEWVAFEVAYWIERRGVDRMTLVLTDGHVCWDKTRNDFDWECTTALPRCLEGRFRGEPQYVDLGAAVSEAATIRERLAILAGVVEGRPTSDVLTHALRLRERNRLKSLTATIVAVSAGLLALTLLGAA